MSPADPHFQAKAPAATHLSAALLRQYAAGTLGADQRRQVERHTLGCPLCADALEGFQQAAPAAVTPAALATLQARLHARVAREPAATRDGGAAWWWAAAAAVALLLTFVGLWQWPRRDVPPPVVARLETPAPAAPAAAPGPAAATDKSAPDVAAAPAAPATAAEAGSPATEPAVAAAPSDVRRRRPATRAAVAARRADDEVVLTQANQAADLSGLDEGAANSAGEVAAAPPAPVEAEAKQEAAPATSDVAAAPTKLAAKAKVAAPAAAPAASEAAAPASAPSEEVSKRKADLPAAPDLAPYPAGGYLAFRSYLQHEQKRPDGGIGGPTHSSGTVKLKFTVEADGSVHDIQVVRGVNPDYDEEAIRLICEGPAWRPAIINGRRAAQSVRLDVPFH